MGFGDELMAAGEAQRVYDEASSSMRVGIYDRRWAPRWHELWEGNPIIAHPSDIARGERVHRVKNGTGCRPYIRYPWSSSRPCNFTNWRANDHRGRVYLTSSEQERSDRLRDRLGPYVVIEPSAKSLNPNKAWIWDRWLALVESCRDVQFVQMTHAGVQRLPGVRYEATASFRDACAVLDGSVGFVGTEGGLHHAAAALNRPAVVIFGGFISPRLTGYDSHINLADTGPGSPCGMWRPCPHCRKAMERITVERVVEGVLSLNQTTREACA